MEAGKSLHTHTTKAMLMIMHLRKLDPNQLVLFLDADLRNVKHSQVLLNPKPTANQISNLGR